MQITKDKVASIDYTLTDDQGTVLDTSSGRDPLAYIHGTGNLIPGLEKELEGKTTGENLKVTIAPEDAYGPKIDDLTQVVPRDRFEDIDKLEVGMQFQTATEAGPQIVTVTNVNDDDITIDGNHPLAGMTLNFEVSVVEVREASQEELDHGHVHGPGGHEH
jgi:FKBP-type peptidyl-prolyl cis-trans isomerase SlyD